MTTSADVAKNLVFDKVKEPNVISYSLKNNANGDSAKEIKLVFNGNTKAVSVNIPKGQWVVVAEDGRIKADGLTDEYGTIRTIKGGKVNVPATSALILIRQ